MWVYRAKLVRVIDGDTVVVDIDLGFEMWLRNQKLRLAGIDTPELRGAEREAGLKAKDALIELLDGKEVTVQTAKSKGRYGRWIATIHADGCNVNEWLVSQGFAESMF